ncbi:unnamed protein product [Rotaria socialis]|uniref:Uncharacterized protein n=1 Tax=Rotaria socialis TaxID=392032 RepID=A0A818AEJ2_9BILA|nr:unnamed protein product [Rotaria socialis]CAF3404953.1 unnamed protein product [Rotaria socialis]CAF4475495.1 unnamed protein product [Rotaria socialis]CAF4629284.1 unnamed protein product [Rotaria socialis]
MPSKRPIKAFYVPKKTIPRDISQISGISPIPYRSHSLAPSPSLHFADINHSPNPMSYSPLGRRSQVSNFSQRENKSTSSIQASSTKHGTERQQQVLRRQQRPRPPPQQLRRHQRHQRAPRRLRQGPRQRLRQGPRQRLRQGPRQRLRQRPQQQQ